jgi:hypothetical protein
MYRIRSASGIEMTFASLEEFTAAVQRGGVSSSDQIYHSRADRWLDVKSHPHYRVAIETPQPRERPPVPQAGASHGRTQVMAKPMLLGDSAPVSAEDGFMVMSSGLDSPIRTAGGSRATAETREPQTMPKHRDSVRVMPRVAVPTAAPPVAAAPIVREPAPAAAPIAAEQPRPQAVPVAMPQARVAESIAPPSPAVVPVPARAPESHETESTETWTSASPEAPGRGSPKSFLIGGAVAAALAIVALLIWRPWSVDSMESIAAQTAPEATAPAPAPDTLLQEFAASVVAATAAQPPAPLKPPEPKVLPAVRPDLRLDGSVPAAEIDLYSAPTTSPVVSLPPSEIARRVAAAEAQARADLDRKLGAFTDLFTPTRLATLEAVRSTRASWVASGDVIRSYRATIARLESAYGDSLLGAQRAQKWPASELSAWSARPSYAEPAETSQIGDLMVDQVAEGLDLLAASSGQYQIKNGRIHFTAANNAARYSVIQIWVSNRTQQWEAMPASTRPATITLLMKALGEGLPTP